MKPTTNIIIYETGEARVQVRVECENLWLSLQQLADLFERDKSVISRHLRNIFAEGELERESVVVKNATTAADGKTYQVEHYNLDAIISVGYRVNSTRATRFRQWATRVLREHLTPGYSLDRQRFEQNAAELEAESDAKNKDVMIRLIENMLALPEHKGG
ncbi:virulence RhuM family protein [Deinococcus sp. S9]|uniref:virulence RhuM family protein n=1 Tax=Deinococcus sp. S9 TaxID=2545754 RepID=UPI001981E811|nr:RhuM family protein [Deinococcus sp. S9]